MDDCIHIDYRTRSWPLPESLPSNEELRFDQVTLFVRPRLPLAIVNYSLGGERKEMGLRIDLDKRVFLSHFDEPELESLASEAAPLIVRHLARLGSRVWEIADEQEQPSEKAAGAFAD